ncbi:MAG: ABC transporter ATP-binding protein [Pirellulaceae bacterium]
MSTAENRYLELWRVSKTFAGPRGPVTIVKDFDLTIRQGEFVSIIGHSGCGKSTVLSIVAGLSDLSTGGIIVAGREIDGAGPDRGMVFQSPSLLPWLTAFDNVMLGVDQVKPRSSRAERRGIVEHYLSLVGLDDAMHKRPAELSQGMRQRVGLARAFALDPQVLLLDEPFGMLDSITRIELQEALMELWAENQKTALMVTHDVDEALYLSDRVVLMTSGPEAHVGDIVTVPFARPRLRPDVLNHADYFATRGKLTTFLEEQDHPRAADAAPLSALRAPTAVSAATACTSGVAGFSSTPAACAK